VNNERVADAEWRPTGEQLLAGSWLVLRRGKKKLAGVHVR
jgi:tyrosyl-tRNA synthetase